MAAAKTNNRTKKEVDLDSLYGIIYKITCDINNKVYVGQTISNRGIDHRFMEHKTSAIKGGTYPLCIDMRAHGVDHFSIEEVERISGFDILNLDARETYYIKELKALAPEGYNTSAAGFSNGKTKQKLMSYYKLKKQDSEDYKARKTRSVQITTSDKGVLNDKIITKIEVSVIHSKLSADHQIRVRVSVDDSRDKYRFQYAKPDVKKNISAALEFVDKIKQEDTDIVISHEVLDLKDNKRDTYKYQDKLDKVLSIAGKLTRISGLIAYHKTLKIWLYTLFFKYENRSQIHKIQFGGKHMSLTEAHENALELIDKLKAVQKCNDSTEYRLKDPTNIDLSSTGSCSAEKAALSQ